MPRRPRYAPGGLVYHVLNRANARAEIFHDSADYAAVERVLAESLRRLPLEIFAYCLMPNHWHLLMRPGGDGDLSQFMRWLPAASPRVNRMDRNCFRVGRPKCCTWRRPFVIVANRRRRGQEYDS